MSDHIGTLSFPRYVPPPWSIFVDTDNERVVIYHNQDGAKGWGPSSAIVAIIPTSQVAKSQVEATAKLIQIAPELLRENADMWDAITRALDEIRAGWPKCNCPENAACSRCEAEYVLEECQSRIESEWSPMFRRDEQ